MDTFFTGTTSFVWLVVTALLLPFIVCLSFFIPYGAGKGLNHLFLSGRSYSTYYLLSAFIGGMGFFALSVMILGAAFLQVFSFSAAEWWYEHLYPVGATGNTIGIIASLSAGLFKGRSDD